MAGKKARRRDRRWRPSLPIQPADGATVPLASLSTFTWKPAPDPDGNPIGAYHIQVSPREDFLQPVSPNFDSLIRSGDARWELPRGWLLTGSVTVRVFRDDNGNGCFDENEPGIVQRAGH